MRVGWLADESAAIGGAELTQAEFRSAAPEGIEIVDCRPGEVVPDLDRYVIQNCVLYTVEDLAKINAPSIRYWHDVGPWLGKGVREWLDENAKPICCSPLQAEYMGLDGALCIPPPVNYAPFTAAAASINGDRRGAVCIGSWRNWGKAPHKAAEWAGNEGIPIDFFGGGEMAPRGSREVPYAHIPGLLASYETFVFLPSVIEPFGRLVAEAYAAGCECIVNELVGSKYWITENPAALETASDDFWKEVLR
jgi:hypothetical protein